MNTQEKRKLCLDLLQHEIIKFGDFKLKSGVNSKIYFDLRSIVSFPKLLDSIAHKYFRPEDIEENNFDLVCGVAYTGIPIASIISRDYEIPMIFRRKEAKSYGTKKQIEGNFKPGMRVLLIDDVITSGSSLIETKQALEEEGLIVVESRVLIDRRDQVEVRENMDKYSELYTNNSNFRALLKIQEVLRYLRMDGIDVPRELVVVPSYENKMQRTQNRKLRQLFEIMIEKKTNLVCSADVATFSELENLLHAVGDYICMVKVHTDIMDNPDIGTKMLEIKKMAQAKKFLILEDRKFCDIGSIVQRQFHGGNTRISSWADVVTCHSLAGMKTIEGLIADPGFDTAILLVAQLSCTGNLINERYTEMTCRMAEQYPDRVMGLISQTGGLVDPFQFVHATPGVNLTAKGDQLGQNYRSPDSIIKTGSDLLIVGRGIYGGSNMTEWRRNAQRYRDAGWSAYESSL